MTTFGPGQAAQMSASTSSQHSVGAGALRNWTKILSLVFNNDPNVSESDISRACGLLTSFPPEHVASKDNFEALVSTLREDVGLVVSRLQEASLRHTTLDENKRQLEEVSSYARSAGDVAHSYCARHSDSERRQHGKHRLQHRHQSWRQRSQV